MPKYLFQVSYTAQGATGVLTDGGSARRAAAEAGIESLGGRIESFYFAFGATDAFVIAELPSPAAAARLGLTLSSSGANTVSTTVLLEPEQIDQAKDLD
ncbi:MAG: GYD domain-containing protein, partial [Acidimicrobiales bacterium]